MAATSESPADVEFPSDGRLIGIDYGTKRIGVSISTPEQNISSPLENYDRRSKKLDGEFLRQIAEENRAVGIVIGLPVHMSGDESQKSLEARRFGTWLSKVTRLPVRYWDERYTSVIAEQYLHEAEVSKKKRKSHLDMIAAQIMLQDYLDSGDRAAGPKRL